MKGFDKFAAAVTALFLLTAAVVNIAILSADTGSADMARVDTERVKYQIQNGTVPDADDYEHIIGIYKNDGSGDFYESRSSYVICARGDELYRIEYKAAGEDDEKRRTLITVNTVMGLSLLMLAGVFVYIRRKIITPFNELSEMPIELAKGNLTTPLKESRSRFFGRFVWGTNMLRETMEKQRERELVSQKDKQTLILSLSHDIKTPLSAIKLYAKALEKGLYDDPEKLAEVYSGLEERADEIPV